MDKTFNSKIKKVTSVGEELRFQREYYCYKNNISLPLKIVSRKEENYKKDTLQTVLYEYMQKHFGDNSEMATSYDVLYAIENGKSKKKSEKYNIDAYFLRMFCLFKIYGFLDTMTILEILKDKYNLQPSFESSKQILNDIEENYTLEKLIFNGKKGKTIKININYGRVLCSKDTALKIFDKNETEQIEKIYNETLNKEHYKYQYKNNEIINKTKIENSEDMCMFGYIFVEEREKLKNKMKKLSCIERQCTSLNLGRDTTYIDSFINGTLQNIDIDTLLKTLEHFNMTNVRFYEVLTTIKRDFSTESIRYSNFQAF